MHISNKLISATFLAAVHLAATNAQLTACPSAETTTTLADGSQYATCPGSDYQGNTANMLANTASNDACIKACNQATGCIKAVYEPSSKNCHLKGDGLTWAADSRFNAIRFVKKVATTTTTTTATAKPTACPTTESVQTAGNGIQYTVCSGSDYQGQSVQVIQSVSTLANCMNLCSGITTCTKAVYDLQNFVCHIKGPDGGLTWAVNPQFATIRKTGSTTSLRGSLGIWSQVVPFPIIPVAAYVVPEQPDSSRILMFSSWGSNDFSGDTGITQFADYNFKTGAVSQRTVTNTNHDMFCPGISSLSDGRIVITGGSNAEAVSIYNPATNQFTRAADMKLARGYQSSTTLSNGKIFTIGGSYSGGIGGKNGEVFDSTTGQWTLLPNADVNQMLTTDHEGAWRTDNHGWLFGWKDGSVFQAGPSKAMHWYGTSGTGSVSLAGTRDAANDAMCGMFAMYDVGKIFTAGGSQDYTDSAAFDRAFLISIDKVGSPATVEKLPAMKNPRGLGNVVVLPDGKLIITGGMTRSIVFSDINAVMPVEVFDPVTRTFKELASMSVPRNYHSVSLLLPDGTVFVGGGGMCPTAYGQSDAHCDRTADHLNGQVFSPPNLFNADGTPATRPVISSWSSNIATNGYKVRAGGTLTVTMADTATVSFVLVRVGSSTHSVNTDQRRIPVTKVVKSGARSTLTLPTDSGVLIPGPWYLFALNANGVPSLAKTIQVTL